MLPVSLGHWVERGLWTWDWRVIGVLLAAGLVYSEGWARLRERGHARLAGGVRVVSYLAGLLAIAVALLSPLDPLGERLFSVHMVQHQVLMYLGAPLLLVGRPLPFFLWGLPAPLRRRLGSWWVPRGPLRRGVAALTQPAVAFGLSTALLWLWHHPALFNLALEKDPVHDLQHLSFFASGLLYWWPLIGSPPQRPRLTTNGARGLYLVAGAVQTGLLGGLIALADRVLYPHYLTVSGVGGLSALADQRLGGAIMWFPGPLVYGLAAWLTMREE